LTCNRGDIKKAYTNLAFIGKLFKTASNALGLKRKYEKRGGENNSLPFSSILILPLQSFSSSETLTIPPPSMPNVQPTLTWQSFGSDASYCSQKFI
jgi:hypothetical protein